MKSMSFKNLFKKIAALSLAGMLVITVMPAQTVEAASAYVKAGKTKIAVNKANTIKVGKKNKGYKMTVSVTGTAKKYVTIKYGSKVLVKNGSTQKAGKKQVVAKKTSISLKARASAKAVNKQYKVKVIYYNGKKNAGTETSKNVTVQPITVKKVALNKTSANLKVGGTVTLEATVTPSNATNKSVTWKSSNTSVATVKSGKVTAVAAGTATITATAGGKMATCKVTVTADEVIKMTGVKLSTSKSDIGETITVTVTVTLEPEKANNIKSYQWYRISDDERIEIKGATTAEYTLEEEDLEYNLICVVTDQDNKEFCSEEINTYELYFEPSIEPSLQ